MAKLSLVFDLIAKDRASREFDKIGDAAGRAGKKGDGFGRAMKGGMFVAGAAIAGVAAGLGAFAATSVKSLGRIEQINAQTATAIESMGGAAGISAKEIEALAGSLESTTAAEAETIQKGANLLLTFGNIKNAAGAGNDVFSQTTGLMVDMARAMGTDADAAAIQLGKALNDPIKGITALTRVGVSFTDEQKNTIKTLTETGDVMGAQKVILGELERQFGGSGEAFAKTTEGKIELAKHAIGTLGETLTAGVLPILGDLAGKAATMLNSFAEGFANGEGAGGRFRDVLGTIKDTFTVFVEAFRGGEVTTLGFLGRVGDAGYAIRDVFDTVKDGVTVFVEALRGGEVTTLGGLGRIGDAGYAVRDAFDTFKTEVLPRLQQFAGFIRDEVVPRVAQFAGMLAENMIPRLKDFGAFVRDEVLPRLVEFGGFLRDTVFPALLKVGDFLRDTFRPAFDALVVLFREKVLPGFERIRQVVMDNLPQLQALATFIGGVIAVAGALVAKVAGFLLPILAKLAGFVFDVLVGAFENIVTNLGLVVDAVQGGWQKFQEFQRIVGLVWEGAKVVVRDGVRSVVERMLDMAEGVLNAADSAFGWIPGLGGQIDTAKEKFADFRDSVNASLGGIKDQVAKITINMDDRAVATYAQSRGLSPASARTILAKQVAAGGPIIGPGTGTSDSIPALLSNGEHVWTAEEVAKAGGHGAVESMRRAVKGMARGGPVKFDLQTSTRGTNAAELVNLANAQSVKALSKVITQAAPLEATGGPIRPVGAGGGNQGQLVAFGRLLEGMGFTVGEHQAFGTGRVGRHSKGSKHYSNPSRAIDVNKGAGTSAREQGYIDSIVGLAKNYGLRTIWRQPDHFNHAHFDYDRGGLMMPGQTGQNSGAGPERVLPTHETQVYDELLVALKSIRNGSTLPSTVVLRVGDREFTAYVDSRAAGVVDEVSRGDLYGVRG